MPEILIQSKITTPRLHDKIVHRERLTKLLEENSNKNLIIICAPAGFGKTTLALDYISRQHNRYIWFGIPNKGIHDISTFFEYLINAFKNINESFGSVTINIMKSYLQQTKLSAEMPSVLTASLVNEFHKNFKDDITIVIDDMHYIDSEKSLKWLNEIFNELLDNIPVNMHLLLISRRMPNFNLTVLSAKRNLFTISEKELNFNEDETAELLEQVYAYKYDSEDVKLLEINLKGWITGIHLLLQAYGGDFNKVKYTGGISTENIFDFFTHEIFENLSKETQEFLIVTSLLENFNADISDAVLEIKKSKDIINELVRKNLFIQQVRSFHKDKPDISAFYIYHALFRNYLNSQLQKNKTEQEIKFLRARIAEYYLSSRDSVSAIDYFLEAKEFERTVPLLIEIFEIMYNKGRLSTLWRWLASFPEKTVNENPYLMYFLGFFYLYVNEDNQKSLSYINKALGVLQLPKDEDIIVWCHRAKSAILYISGKNEEALTELQKFSTLKLKPENKASIFIRLAQIYSTEEPYTALNLYEEALLIFNEQNIKKSKSDIYNGIAVCYNRIGDFTKGPFYLKKALEEADNLHLKLIINVNISLHYCELGNFNKSRTYLQRVSKLLDDVPPNVSFIHFLKSEANLLYCIGYFEKSIELSKKEYVLAEKNNDLRTMCESDLNSLLCYYHLNEHNMCLQYLNRGLENADSRYKSIFQMFESVVLMENNLEPSVEAKLLNSYTYFDSKDTALEKSEASFYLSNYYLRNNMPDSALNYLRIFLNTKSANQHLGAHQNDILKSRFIFDFALSRPELKQYKDFVKQIFAGVFDRLNLEWTSDEYKSKMKIQVETLYDIKMTSFGGLQFISRGNPIPESKWRKKKGKSMLAYMMLNPEAKYNKEKLIDIFFPDTSRDTVEENFRQAVFNIRSVFKIPYLNILLYEGKMLNLNPDCYYKSDAAEFDKSYKITRSPGKNTDGKIQACKNAIDLYKGEFLEGYYEQWCEDVRNEYANKFISISELLLTLLQVAPSGKEKENYEEIIDYSENLLKHDNLNEHAYLSLIEAYTKLAQTKSARDVYARMLKTYETELGEKPNSKALIKIKNLLGN